MILCFLQLVGGPKPPIPSQGQAEAGAEPAGGIPNQWWWQWWEPKRPVPIPNPAARHAKWLGQFSPSLCVSSSVCLNLFRLQAPADRESLLRGCLQDAKPFRCCCQRNNRLGHFNTGEAWMQVWSPFPLVKPDTEVLVYSNLFSVAPLVMRVY